MANNAADADLDFGAASSPEGNTASHSKQVHKQSGYTWTREADEPGFTWKNKKATDEMQRTSDGLAHRDLMVKGRLVARWCMGRGGLGTDGPRAGRYGDPVEVAAKEREMMTGTI